MQFLAPSLPSAAVSTFYLLFAVFLQMQQQQLHNKCWRMDVGLSAAARVKDLDHPWGLTESLFPKPVAVAARELRDLPQNKHINLHLKGNWLLPRPCVFTNYL